MLKKQFSGIWLVSQVFSILLVYYELVTDMRDSDTVDFIDWHESPYIPIFDIINSVVRDKDFSGLVGVVFIDLC